MRAPMPLAGGGAVGDFMPQCRQVGPRGGGGEGFRVIGGGLGAGGRPVEGGPRMAAAGRLAEAPRIGADGRAPEGFVRPGLARSPTPMGGIQLQAREGPQAGAPQLRRAVTPAGPLPAGAINGGAKGFTRDIRAATEDGDESPSKGSLKRWFEDPEKLNQFVQSKFRECARTRHGSQTFLVFEDMEPLARSLANQLKVNPRIFGEINQMFWRFDFQGDGKLSEDEGCSLLLFMLRQYRDHVSPPEPGQVRLGGKILYKNLRANYDITKKLGEGGQGVALLATAKGGGEGVCVKMYDKSNPSAPLEDITQEFELLIGLKHPRIAHVFEIFQDASNIYIVQEAYHGGDLTEALQNAHKHNVKVNEPWLAKVIYQVVSGVNFLHTKHIMHCDLKEPNVMIASNSGFDSPQVVVIDFGLANQFHSKSQPGGTPGYMPPEVWPPMGLWTPKGDVFSIGIMLFALRTGRSPFTDQARSLDEICQRTKSSIPVEMDAGLKVSAEMKGLVSAMLCKDFLARPAMREVMDHPWFQSKAQAENFHASILMSLAKRDQKQDLHRALLADVAAKQNLAQMKELNALFMGIDADGDGQISQDEVRNCLTGKKGWSADQIERLIGVLIGDREEVAYDEFMGQLIASKGSQEKEMLWSFFDEMDTDGNGVLSREELQGLLQRPAIHKVLGDKKDEILRDFERSGKGEFSFEDFCRKVYGKDVGEAPSKKQKGLEVGQEVEYYSASFSTWVPCEVTAFDERTGSIQISAKPGFWMSQVEVQKRIRPKASEDDAGEASPGTERQSLMERAKAAGFGRQLLTGGLKGKGENLSSTEHIEEAKEGRKSFFSDLKQEAKDGAKEAKKNIKNMLGF